MAKTDTPAPTIPNKLNLTEQDFANLVSVISNAVQNSHTHVSGNRFVTVPKKERGMPPRRLHLQVPKELENLPDDHPSIVSWVMSEIHRDAYKPGFYRKMPNEFAANPQNGLPVTFSSHNHNP